MHRRRPLSQRVILQIPHQTGPGPQKADVQVQRSDDPGIVRQTGQKDHGVPGQSGKRPDSDHLASHRRVPLGHGKGPGLGPSRHLERKQARGQSAIRDLLHLPTVQGHQAMLRGSGQAGSHDRDHLNPRKGQAQIHCQAPRGAVLRAGVALSEPTSGGISRVRRAV